MPSDSWQHVRRLLVMCPEGAMEVVHTAPALQALHRALPDAHIALMVTPSGSAALPLIPWVDEVIVADGIWSSPAPDGSPQRTPEREIVEQIRAGRFDAAIVFTSARASPSAPAYACYLAGVPVRVAQSKEFTGAVLSTWIKPPPDSVHPADRHLALLKAVGFADAERGAALQIPAEFQVTAETDLRLVGVEPEQSYLFVSPNLCDRPDPYRPLEYSALARVLAARTRMPAIVADGSAAPRGLPGVLAAQPDGTAVSLAGAPVFPEYAALIRRADLVVAGDPLTRQLAEAFGRPTIAVDTPAQQPAPQQSAAICRALADLLPTRQDTQACVELDSMPVKN